MTRKGRKRFFDVVRVAICLAALWIVLRSVTFSDHVERSDGTTLVGTVVADQPLQMRLEGGDVVTIPDTEVATDPHGGPKISYGLASAWRRSDKSLLLLALVVQFPIAFPLAQRFRLLLRAQGIELTFFESLRLTFAGNFLNFTTPLGSNAGDLFKAYFASLHTPRKTEAVTTVVLDRVIGLGTLVVVAALITAFAPGGGRLVVLRPYMWALLAIGAVLCAAYFSPLARSLRIPASWPARIPALSHVRRVDKAVRAVVSRGWTLGTCVLLTVFLQLLALSSYFVVAVAVSMNATAGRIPEYFAYYYAGAVIQALPGPPQGLGTVELAYQYFFAPYGSASQIICMAFAIRLLVLVSALPGLLVAMTGSYRPAELQQAVEAMDQPDGDVPGHEPELSASSSQCP